MEIEEERVDIRVAVARDIAVGSAHKQAHDLLSAAAHDLKTPLTLINGLASELHDTRNCPEQVREEYIERICFSTERLIGLLDDILTTARINHMQLELPLEAIRPSEVIEEAAHELAPLAKTYEHDLEIVTPRHVPPVMANKRGLFRIVYNFLDNAIKYSHPDTPIEVRTRKDGAQVRISVRDEGVGISQNDINKVFEKFGQAHQPLAAHAGSSGLGLYIVKQLTDAMRGTLGVTRLAKGTSFYVKLPTGKETGGQLKLF